MKSFTKRNDKMTEAGKGRLSSLLLTFLPWYRLLTDISIRAVNPYKKLKGPLEIHFKRVCKALSGRPPFFAASASLFPEYRPYLYTNFPWKT